jgi:hypothetical protein
VLGEAGLGFLPLVRVRLVCVTWVRVRQRNVDNNFATLCVGMPASCRMASRGSSSLDSESCVGVVQKHWLPFSKAPAKTQMFGADVRCLL